MLFKILIFTAYHKTLFAKATDSSIQFTYMMSQKKCDLGRLVQNCTLFCGILLYGVFNIVWKFVFVLVLQWPPKKSANLFSLKIKGSEKQKCVYKLFLSKSKIVWVLRFQLKTKQRIFNTLEYVRRKELENLNNFSLKIRLEPKIANFLITICKLSVGFPT